MSRTGNLLFPEDQDGGWVAAIQKALPKEDEKKDSGENQGGIPDPVADAADAAFAEVAADVATQDAIFAAGWSADAVKPEIKAPEISDPVREALESVVNLEVEGGEDLDFGEDPVAVEAEAAFAEISAETAARDAIEAAGWTAEAALPAIDLAEKDIAPMAAQVAAPQPDPKEADFAGWSAASVRSEPEIVPRQELEALDAVVAEVGQTKRFTEIEDPVGFAADAVFAETAAQVAEREAVRAARKEDEDDHAATLGALGEHEPEANPGPRRMLSAEEQMPLENDPVALEADAAFSQLAADVAIDDAILAARWRARPGPDDVVAALREKPDPAESPGFEEIPDLVRAEAEIAFDDAAYDLAYSTVDSLVSGEAAALNAFDQAIQSGADPEEALAAAITAAEAIDPGAFGLTRVSALAIEPDDFTFAALDEDQTGPLSRPRRGREESLDSEKEQDGEQAGAEGEEIFVATLGEGFNDDPAQLRVAEDGGVDVLLGTGYTFVFDPDLISIPALGKRVRNRDDDLVAGTDADNRIDGTNGADTLTGGAGPDNIFGYAGDDVLVGGQGDDTLTGGAGADEFRFAGGTGADALARAVSLGTDTVTDFSTLDGDRFGLSNADFGFGDAGTLTDGTDYYEYVATTLGGAPLDVSGGSAGAAIVVIGDGSGTDGVGIYYTEDASAMTTDNSYQIADVDGINTADISAGDFSLKS